MAQWINEDIYQFEDERELITLLCLDPDTIEGDYAEAYHHMTRMWGKSEIDTRFIDKGDFD